MDAAARHLEATKALLCSLDASVARSVFAEEGSRGAEEGTRGDDEPARRIQCCFRCWRARQETDRRRLASFLQEEARARQRREAFVRDTMNLLDSQSQERGTYAGRCAAVRGAARRTGEQRARAARLTAVGGARSSADDHSPHRLSPARRGGRRAPPPCSLSHRAVDSALALPGQGQAAARSADGESGRRGRARAAGRRAARPAGDERGRPSILPPLGQQRGRQRGRRGTVTFGPRSRRARPGRRPSVPAWRAFPERLVERARGPRPPDMHREGRGGGAEGSREGRQSGEAYSTDPADSRASLAMSSTSSRFSEKMSPLCIVRKCR